MIKLPFRVSLLFLFCISIMAAPSASAQTIYVRAGKLVDPMSATVSGDQLLLIEDGRIAAVGPYAPPPKGSIVIDWSAYTVLPGLIDMHTHMVDTEQSSNVAEPLLHSAAKIALLGAKHAKQTLHAGFTSVRDVGAFRAFGAVALRDAIEAGWVEGPRMMVAGAYLTVPGGGGDRAIAETSGRVRETNCGERLSRAYAHFTVRYR